MADFEMDAQFERRLAASLVEFGNSAVRPFDAASIAAQAVARVNGRARRWSLDTILPRSWRPLLLLALLAVGLIAVGIVGGFIKLPNNNINPNPSYQPTSPLPTLATPSPGTNQTANPTEPPVSIAPGGSFGTAAPVVSPTPAPIATDTPTVTPTDVLPSPSPTSAPTPSPSPSPTTTPTPTVAPVNKVVAVTTGDNHACALADDGRVFCWGYNDVGQLGLGTTDGDYHNYGTVPVVGIDDAKAIAAGLRFTCAVRVDGTVWCWGEDPGSDGSSALPFQVLGIDDATAVTAGGQFACALRSNGQIGCWGNGQVGQLGNGIYENNSGVPTPQTVLGIDNATAVSAGWAHACALLADGTVDCWGANGDGATVYGNLGDGTSDPKRATPGPVVGLDNVTAIAVGGWSTCATRLDGTVWCWGYGEQGELGDGNFSDSSVPIQVSLIDDARLLALGDHTACVSRSDDSVWCWGHTNWIGQDNPGNEAPGTPRQGNKSRPSIVTALANHGYCLLIDNHGKVWWWGDGTNQAPESFPVGP